MKMFPEMAIDKETATWLECQLVKITDKLVRQYQIVKQDNSQLFHMLCVSSWVLAIFSRSLYEYEHNAIWRTKLFHAFLISYFHGSIIHQTEFIIQCQEFEKISVLSGFHHTL